MRTEGNCGRGGRDYTGAESVLNGRLASEHHEPVESEDDDEAETTEVPSCEHGVPLEQVEKCRDCAWLYGWDARQHGQ